jgi:hypothetical protein
LEDRNFADRRKVDEGLVFGLWWKRRLGRGWWWSGLVLGGRVILLTVASSLPRTLHGKVKDNGKYTTKKLCLWKKNQKIEKKRTDNIMIKKGGGLCEARNKVVRDRNKNCER